MIPIFTPSPQYEALKTSIDDALMAVAASGQYILGPHVTEFETQFAHATQTAHAIGVNSGSDALYLALRALGIGPGDDVITTCFSYVATSEAIVRTGAQPVFVDISPETFNMDLTQVEAAITESTRAILPVHLFGLPVDMTALMALAKQYQLYVVEDCAQATGATWNNQPVGSIGHIGCFSFFPTKNLGALGDAGAVTTQDADLAAKIRSLRVHGGTPENRYDHQQAGINSRLDSLQAAVLSLKLPYLTQWNHERQAIAAFYTEALSNSKRLDRLFAPVLPPEGQGTHVFHQYTLRLQTDHGAARNALQDALKNLGVMAMIYYPIPLHLQQTHRSLGYHGGDFPQAERVSNQVLSLPIFPGMTPEQQTQVVTALEEAMASLLSRP